MGILERRGLPACLFVILISLTIDNGLCKACLEWLTDSRQQAGGYRRGRRERPCPIECWMQNWFDAINSRCLFINKDNAKGSGEMGEMMKVGKKLAFLYVSAFIQTHLHILSDRRNTCSLTINGCLSLWHFAIHFFHYHSSIPIPISIRLSYSYPSFHHSLLSFCRISQFLLDFPSTLCSFQSITIRQTSCLPAEIWMRSAWLKDECQKGASAAGKGPVLLSSHRRNQHQITIHLHTFLSGCIKNENDFRWMRLIISFWGSLEEGGRDFWSLREI